MFLILEFRSVFCIVEMSKIIVFLLIFCVLNLLNFVENFNVDILTTNFFNNLQANPRLIDKNSLIDYNLDDNSRNFIKQQVQNYINLVTRKKQQQSNKKKRSLAGELIENFSGISILNEITPITKIPSKFSKDIVLFEQSNQWYVAILESSTIKEPANQLKIYKISDNTFEFITEISVENAIKISTFPLDNTTLIIVVENGTLHDKSGLYRFDMEKMHKIQRFNLINCSDVEFWRIHEEVYLGLVYFQKNNQYETDMLIYKWLGGHFDLVQTIKTKSPKKITPFEIKNSYYLAIANFQDNNKKTNIYSEIFKYNHHKNKYELYQRISTKACSDIEFFTIQNSKNHREYFLITANLYEDNNNEIDYETDSIVYKFVDNYFIPFQSFRLNGLENWLPITNVNNSITLLANTRYEGLRIFQYDGWSFVEITLQKSNQIPQKSIKSLHYYPDYNQTLIITQKNTNSSMFRIDFSHQNPMKKIHDDLLEWCQKNRNIINNLQNNQILGKSQRGDITIDENIDKIEKKIDSIEKSVAKIEENLKTTLQSTVDREIDRKLVAKQLIFHNDIFIDNLNTVQINNEKIDEILSNSFNITKDFHINNYKFDSVLIMDDNSLIIEEINNKSTKSLIYNNEKLILDELKIDKIICKDGLKVVKINDIEINNQNLLLTNQNQYFTKPIQLDSCKIHKLDTDYFNKFNLSILSNLIDMKIEKVSSIENLTVNQLIIGGLINNVDIPTLDKYTLKLNGDQSISELYIFKNLTGTNLITNSINNKHLNNLIDIDNGSYRIDHEVIFTNNLTINRLEIVDSLNNIQINNNKFDALFKNIDEKQTIIAKKKFTNLEILNPIDLRGKINCEKCKITNPVVAINQDLLLFDNYTIDSLVTIEEFLKIDNIETVNNRTSLQKLKNYGLKLDTKEIDIRLNFAQQLNVDEVFLEKINNINLNDFVINGGTDVQIIEDLKIFNHDVYVDGSSEIFKINDIDLEEFDRNVLRQNGDQIIHGKHHIKHAIIDSISSNNTNFGETSWETFMNLNTNQNLNQTLTIKETLTTETLTTNHLIINGLINDYNFTELISDTARKSENSTIKGYKTFNSLTIDNLTIQSGFKLIDIDQIFDETNRVLNVEKSVNFHEPISIATINFSEDINGVNLDQFKQIDENLDEIHVIKTKLNLTNLIILGETFVNNSKINDVNIEDLLETTVKINENNYFEYAIFDTIISEQPVLIHGEIERVDFDNLLLSDSNLEQILYDHIKFLDNLTINGNIKFDGFVNNLNLSEFCDFTMGQIDKPKNLIINNGHVYFVKGPNIRNINSFDTDQLWENAWFTNRNTTLNGFVTLKSTIFEDDISIDGFIGDIDLLELSNNYFSKSKNQIIPGNFEFSNPISFESNLTIRKINHNGRINEINLEKFINNILLDDYNQTFENTVYLENCTIDHLNGEFLLNNYNLQTDLMRYDQINIVTGMKTIENLFVEHLKIDRNIQLQNIEIVDWLDRIVTKSGDFNIDSYKKFTNISTTNGLNLLGYLNGLHIDEENIMVTNKPQNISGKKTFMSNLNRFKGVKLKGLLNNIEMDKFIENQALKNRDNIFKTDINFYNNNITTRNLIGNQHFQNLNLTQLIVDVENFGVINNLLDNYHNLLTMASRIDKSIQNRAYFLYDYEIIQTLTGFKDSFRLIHANGTEKIAGIYLEDNHTRILLHDWNTDSQKISGYHIIEYNSTVVTYIDQVLMRRYLYFEENFNTCYFVEFSDYLALFEEWTRSTNRTISSTSFILPTTNESCTLFIYKFSNPHPEIYCEIDEDLRLMQSFPEISGAYKATSIMIDNTLVLFIINRATNNMKSGVSILYLNQTINQFVFKQKINVAEPRSLSVVSMKHHIFLSIASGHLQDSFYSGKIIIKKYGKFTKRFDNYQNIPLNSPKQVEFSVLPTNELILYVVTDNPIQSLLIYRYEGINRFQQKFIGRTLTKIDYLYQYISKDRTYFIVTHNNDEITILKLIFKGGN